MQVELVMFKADGTRRNFPVKPGGFVIGRKNNCDLRIPLSSVSRKHCVIKVEDGQIKLQDAGSSNGTFVNSTRVQETLLKAGDELVVGPVVFTVVVDGEPKDIEPVRSLVESAKAKDESVVVPADLLKTHEADPTGGEDTLHEGEEGEDPFELLDDLAELELPDSDAKSS